MSETNNMSTAIFILIVIIAIIIAEIFLFVSLNNTYDSRQEDCIRDNTQFLRCTDELTICFNDNMMSPCYFIYAIKEDESNDNVIYLGEQSIGSTITYNLSNNGLIPGKFSLFISYCKYDLNYTLPNYLTGRYLYKDHYTKYNGW